MKIHDSAHHPCVGRPVYFDCDIFGEFDLWVGFDSTGMIGGVTVVKDTDFQEVWEIFEDEIFPEADDTIEGIAGECETTVEKLMDNPVFQEGYGFRPNGPNKKDKKGHGIYWKDLNGVVIKKATDLKVTGVIDGQLNVTLSREKDET